MPRIFTIIPAAGLSRRMGQPKLLIDLGDKTVLARLLQTLVAEPGLDDVFVVVRASDIELAEEATRHGAKVICPSHDPPEMRDSVELALREIAATRQPDETDSWSLIPADHPLLKVETLQKILNVWNNEPRADILIPTYQNRGGHPTLFRWKIANEVFDLPPECGLNRLLQDENLQIERHEIADELLCFDLDTPEDLARARALLEEISAE